MPTPTAAETLDRLAQMQARWEHLGDQEGPSAAQAAAAADAPTLLAALREVLSLAVDHETKYAREAEAAIPWQGNRNMYQAGMDRAYAAKYAAAALVRAIGNGLNPRRPARRSKHVPARCPECDTPITVWRDGPHSETTEYLTCDNPTCSHIVKHRQKKDAP